MKIALQNNLDHIVSNLNHVLTGSLARLEGLYHLYKVEGCFREELWEEAFQEANLQVKQLLEEGFTLHNEQ